MDETIDKLQIEIESNSDGASNGLEKLIGTLSAIKAVVTPASDSFRQLRDAIDGLNKSAVNVNLEPMRNAFSKLVDASKGINEIDFSGVLEIGNAFRSLTGMFEGADMEIGTRLVQFTQQLKWGVEELSSVGRAIDEGAMQKLVNIGATIGELNTISNLGSVDSSGLIRLAHSISNAIPLLTDAGNMIDYATIERLRDFAYVLPEISQLLGSTSSKSGSGIASTVSSLYSLSDALSNLNSIVFPSAQNLMDLRSALASFSGLRANFDAAGLRAGISGIASAARAISKDEAQRLNILGTALNKLNSNFANMKSLSLSAADELRESVLRVMDACRQIDESSLARLSALQDALSELRQSGGIQGLLEQSTQISGGSSRGGIGGIGATFQTASSGIQATIRGIGGALDWLRNRISLSNTALGSFLSGLARIAKYRLLRTIIKGFTSGASEGLENLAHASEEANATLTRLSTTSLLLKNSMGGALYSALATAMNWITAVGDAAARAIDFLSQFFAILGGRTTYMKATSATQDFLDTTDKATGSVKSLKQELMGFDEINALSPDRVGGGGRGGKNEPDYGAMFEEAPVSKWLQDMMKSGDFSEFGKAVAEKINDALAGINWSKIQAGAKKVVNSVTSAINGFFKEMNPSVWGRTIANAINTAAQFVSSFWNDTDWELIGRKVKSSILVALRDIDAETLANAIVGRIKAAFTFLRGLLPSNADEWREITGKIAAIIQKIITNIPAELIGNTIGNLIHGGLSLITSLGEANTLTNIAKAIKTTLESAFENFTEDDAKQALASVIEDVKSALGVLLTMKINIGDFEFSAVGAVIMAPAVFNAIRGALMGVFSNTGMKTEGGRLSLVGALAFGLDAFTSISDIVEDTKNGKALDYNKVIDIGKSAFESMGFMLNFFGKNGIGALSFGLSAAFQLVGDVMEIVEGVENGSSVNPQDLVDVVSNALLRLGLSLPFAGSIVGGAFFITLSLGIKLVTGIIEIADNITTANVLSAVKEIQDSYGDVSLTAEQLEKVNSAVQGIRNQTASPIATFGLLTLAGDGAVLAAVMEQTGYTIEEVAKMANLTDEQLDALGITMQGVHPVIQDIGDTASGAASSIHEMPVAVDEFIGSVSDTTGTVSTLNTAMESAGTSVTHVMDAYNTLNKVDFSGANKQIGGVGSAFDKTVPHITATGDAADSVNEKIVEIPSKTTVYINIDNYSSLISDLDTINSKFKTITDSVNALRLKVSIDMTTAITTFKSRVNGEMKTATTTMGTQLDTLKRKVNNLKDAIKNIKNATASIKVNAGLSSGARRFLESLQNLDTYAYSRIHPVLKYSQFAAGGYPQQGEMFIANEAGPELVGKIGNRTAVANEEQIGDAIFQYMDEYGGQSGGINYDAMAAAMVSALRSAGLGSVYLDGRMLAQSINRESARSGRPAINY